MSNKKILVLILLIIALIFLLRIPALGVSFFNVDEAVFAVTASTILDGGFPYRDAVDHQGPVIYYIYALAFLLFGKFNMQGVHFVFICLIALEAWIIFRIGRKAAGARAGLLAALFFAVFSWVSVPSDMWSANTEWLVILFSSLGVLVFLHSMLLDRLMFLLVAGYFFGLSSLSKQLGLFDLASVILFLFITDAVFKKDRKQLAVKYLTLFAGVLIPLCIALYYYQSYDVLKDYLFYTWGYNMTYYVPELSFFERMLNAPGPVWHFFKDKTLLLICFAGAFGFALRDVIKKDYSSTTKFLLYFFLWSAFSTVAASWSGRAYPHYYILILPSVCLLAGIGFDRAWERMNSLNLRRLAAAVFILGCAYPITKAVEDYYPRYYKNENFHASLVNHIQNNSDPKDKIFVWGYAPEIYALSKRSPATRFIYCNVLTGLIPGANTDEDVNTDHAVVPETWNILMEELNSRKPKFIVDASHMNWMYYGKYPISRYPQLAEFIKKHYVLDADYPPNHYQGPMKLLVRKHIISP